MTRIYEALQRATLEQKATPVTEYRRLAESMVAPEFKESSLATADAVLGGIAQQDWNPSIASLLALDDRGAGVEQFRRLRSRISLLRDELPMKTILVCSGMPMEGKTFVVANLAISLARNSRNRVLLIDGDLRRARLHVLLGAPNTPGLSDYLAGTAEPAQIMQRSGSPKTVENAGIAIASNLTFIPAGKCGDNSSELVANHRIEELIKRLSPHFDWILIDTPPVLIVTDAVDLASAADAVLLVARGATTPFDVAQRAQAAFSNFRILGFVLNAVKNAPRDRHYYGYSEVKEVVGGVEARLD